MAVLCSDTFDMVTYFVVIVILSSGSKVTKVIKAMKMPDETGTFNRNACRKKVTLTMSACYDWSQPQPS